MSFSDRAILWLHIVAAVFTIGPGTAAIMSTPRYIRKRNIVLVGYLYRITRIYAAGSLLVLIFGLIMTQLIHAFSRPWVSVSITLYIVAAVLLLLIMRDQRHAIVALRAAEGGGDATARSESPETETGEDATAAGAVQPTAASAASSAPAISAASAASSAADAKIAAVERGRIASMSGMVGLIWLVSLVLMAWNG
jgi:hypothetical protein